MPNYVETHLKVIQGELGYYGKILLLLTLRLYALLIGWYIVELVITLKNFLSLVPLFMAIHTIISKIAMVPDMNKSPWLIIGYLNEISKSNEKTSYNGAFSARY